MGFPQISSCRMVSNERFEVKKVNLFIVGSAKCGTTYLASILEQHPFIGFCVRKEPRFLENLFEFLGLTSKININASGRRNPGETKFYDTRFRRLLRRTRMSGRLAHGLERRSSLIYRTLRKRFESPIEWSGGSKEETEQSLKKYLIPFLQRHGRPASLWFPK